MTQSQVDQNLDWDHIVEAVSTRIVYSLHTRRREKATVQVHRAQASDAREVGLRIQIWFLRVPRLSQQFSFQQWIVLWVVLRQTSPLAQPENQLCFACP